MPTRTAVGSGTIDVKLHRKRLQVKLQNTNSVKVLLRGGRGHSAIALVLRLRAHHAVGHAQAAARQQRHRGYPGHHDCAAQRGGDRCHERVHGGAVQVDPRLTLLAFQRLKLNEDKPLSHFAFNSNLRPSSSAEYHEFAWFKPEDLIAAGCLTVAY